MIDWDFYARRSGATLEGFLSDTNSYSEALEKFQKRGLNPPPSDEIMKVFELKMSKNFQMPDLKDKNQKSKTTDRVPKKRIRKKANKVPKTDKKAPDKNDKEYFRKVLPTKNK